MPRAARAALGGTPRRGFVRIIARGASRAAPPERPTALPRGRRMSAPGNVAGRAISGALHGMSVVAAPALRGRPSTPGAAPWLSRYGQKIHAGCRARRVSGSLVSASRCVRPLSSQDRVAVEAMAIAGGARGVSRHNGSIAPGDRGRKAADRSGSRARARWPDGKGARDWVSGIGNRHGRRPHGALRIRMPRPPHDLVGRPIIDDGPRTQRALAELTDQAEIVRDIARR